MKVQTLCMSGPQCFHTLIMCTRRFHDICLNHTSMEFQYYVDPAEAETPLFYHYLNGHPHFTFPSDFIMTGHVHILPYTPWAPKVMSLCWCCHAALHSSNALCRHCMHSV